MPKRSNSNRLAGMRQPSYTPLTSQANPTRLKYRIGSQSDKYEAFKSHSPVFAFDYISLSGSDFCFDSTSLGRKDYIDLLKGLQRISAETYDSMCQNYQFHFHKIDWNEVSVKESDFNKCVGCSSGEIEPYQFKLFAEARLIGFIYEGVFYIVMYDRHHKAYERK